MADHISIFPRLNKPFKRYELFILDTISIANLLDFLNFFQTKNLVQT